MKKEQRKRFSEAYKDQCELNFTAFICLGIFFILIYVMTCIILGENMIDNFFFEYLGICFGLTFVLLVPTALGSSYLRSIEIKEEER